MAGHLYSVPLLSGADLSVNGTQTVAQLITPSTRRLWLLELAFSGKSVVATDVPIRIDLVRQTSAGTGGSTVTPAPRNPDHPPALVTVNTNLSAEPTDGGVMPAGPWFVSPVGGLYVYQMPLGIEVELPISARLGIRIFTAQLTLIRGNFLFLE